MLMRITGTILLLFSMTTSAVAWSGCGVTFTVPKGWNVEQEGKAKEKCAIGISPKGWQQAVAKSRYDDDKFAVHVIILRGTIASAATKLGFEKNEAGAWGELGRGPRVIAEAVRFGAFRGWRSEALSRGFAREGAALGQDSRVWSSVWISHLLHDGHGTIICIQYNQWNPAIKIDRVAADPKHGFKDKHGQLLRQVARFRVYGYDAAGNVVGELNDRNAEVAWQVHVANHKAEWYQFDEAMDIPNFDGSGGTTPQKSARRNASVTGAARAKLVIDPGPRTISGRNTKGKKYQFDGGKFFGKPAPPGEARTDDPG